MKQSFTHLLGLGCLMALASCYTWQPPEPGPHQGSSLDQGPGGNRYWSGPADAQQTPDVADPNQPQGQPQQPGDGNYLPPTPGGDPAAVQAPSNQPLPPGGGNNSTVGVPQQPPAPKPPPTAPAPEQKPGAPPYGVKVPGKTGFVYSPYDKTAGIVDVQGMAPGTKVKCPYTGKVFIVP